MLIQCLFNDGNFIKYVRFFVKDRIRVKVKYKVRV